MVQRQHNTNQANRVELLISIGRKYQGQEEDAKALPVFEQAYKISREVDDHSTRARASCALGSALADHGQPARAETLVEEGLHELPNAPQFVLDRIFCQLRGREVASDNGASQEEIARAQAAESLLQQSPVQSDSLQLSVSIDVGESYREAGQFSKAIAEFEKTSVQMANLGRDDTEQAGTLFNNWGLALFQLGRPLEAEKIYRRAIDIGKASQNEEAVSPTLLNNYAVALWDLGRLPEAADYAERACEKSRQTGTRWLFIEPCCSGQGFTGINTELLRRRRCWPKLRRYCSEVFPQVTSDSRRWLQSSR